MPLGLLDSQFETLQEPTPDEQPIIVEVGGRPAATVAEILRQLKQRQEGDRPHERAPRASGERA